MDIHHSLTYFALILAAALIGGSLVQRLRQPALVGYIAVGFIVGPAMLGLVKSVEEIAFLAEIGILLLLFIVGMEIDLRAFKSVSRLSLVTCAAQIVFGLASMLLLGSFMGWPLNLCILLGFAVSLSSTAVALNILEEMGLRRAKVGRYSIGILIAQDLAVIPMILIIGALSTAEGFNYWGLLRLAIAVALLVALLFFLTRQPALFQKIWSKFERTKEGAMKGQAALTALALCFSAAALSGLAGLSPAYGAFLAGIALGQTRNHKELEKNIKPIFDVMIMVFFLSIGLLIDPAFLKDHWVAVLALLFTTMFLKTVVNIFLLRRQGIAKEDAYITGAALGQVGEFSFLLAAMGLASGVIDNEGYKYVGAIITLSLLFTPFWLRLVKKMKKVRTATLLQEESAS